jgi:hypothetical protein
MNSRGKFNQFSTSVCVFAYVPHTFRIRSEYATAHVPHTLPHTLSHTEALEGFGKAVPDFWYGCAKKPASGASC